MDNGDIVPYPCVFIDAPWKEIFRAAGKCIIGNHDKQKLTEELQKMWVTAENENHVLPCLSVRTALDLFLRVMKFPPRTEIIMSAINIPDMSRILHHHQMKIVPIDVDIDTCTPKFNLLEKLITKNTKVLMLAHLYGKSFDAGPFIEIAHKHGILVIEDMAEAFLGFDRTGHPEADLSLFSFGVIKFSTAFGGAIAKIKCKDLYTKMSELHSTYPVQSHSEYLKKVLKYIFLAATLNITFVTRLNLNFIWMFDFDMKRHVVSMLRGFPDQLITRLRHQPCTALLSTLVHRLKHFDQKGADITTSKGDYVTERLCEKVAIVGNKAPVKSYWLFPIVVDNPDEIVKVLNALGIDAYRGATQLNLVEPDNGDNHLEDLDHFATRYPHEAKFIIDHVVYLPVTKLVPFSDLDKICKGLENALKICDEKSLMPIKRGFKLQSKL